MDAKWEPKMVPGDVNPSPGEGEAKEGDAADRTMDVLTAAARLEKGAVVMDDTGATPLTDFEVQRIAKRVEAFFTAQERLPSAERVSRTKLAKAIGESPSTLSQVLGGKYPANQDGTYAKRDAVLRKCDKHLSIVEARREAPQRSSFVWTSVAEELRVVAHTCVELETMGCAYGPAGIGKSLTMHALEESIPGTVLLTIDDESNTPARFYRTLAYALKLGAAALETRSTLKAIREHLTGTRRLIILDEAHLAGHRVLNSARQLYDSTGCPTLLVGLPSLYSMIQDRRGDDSYGATLASRCGIVRDLTARTRTKRGGPSGERLYSVADIRQLFARSKLRIAPDALEYLGGLAEEPESGGLRQANNAVRIALLAAQKSHRAVQEITLQDILNASGLLMGSELTDAIAARIRGRRAVKTV